MTHEEEESTKCPFCQWLHGINMNQPNPFDPVEVYIRWTFWSGGWQFESFPRNLAWAKGKFWAKRGTKRVGFREKTEDPSLIK